jgi:hypothetical protein
MSIYDDLLKNFVLPDSFRFAIETPFVTRHDVNKVAATDGHTLMICNRANCDEQYPTQDAKHDFPNVEKALNKGKMIEPIEFDIATRCQSLKDDADLWRMLCGENEISIDGDTMVWFYDSLIDFRYLRRVLDVAVAIADGKVILTHTGFMENSASSVGGALQFLIGEDTIILIMPMRGDKLNARALILDSTPPTPREDEVHNG